MDMDAHLLSWPLGISSYRKKIPHLCLSLHFLHHFEYPEGLFDIPSHVFGVKRRVGFYILFVSCNLWLFLGGVMWERVFFGIFWPTIDYGKRRRQGRVG